MQSELFYREDNGRRRAHIKYRIVEIVQQTGKNVKIASVFIFLGVIEISFCLDSAAMKLSHQNAPCWTSV